MGETFGRTDRFGCRPEASTRSSTAATDQGVVGVRCFATKLRRNFRRRTGRQVAADGDDVCVRDCWWVVLGGITAATTAVHLISVAVGHYLGAALPTHLIGILAGVAFVLFGLWTLRGDRLSADEADPRPAHHRAAFFAVMSAFVLAELGDKTMLATVTLAADNDWVGVWIGSTLGMVAADALAIVVGAIAGKHLPERFIQLTAAALFLAFGVGMLVDGILPAAPIPVVVGSAVAVVVLFAAVLRALPKRWRRQRCGPSLCRSP